MMTVLAIRSSPTIINHSADSGDAAVILVMVDVVVMAPDTIIQGSGIVKPTTVTLDPVELVNWLLKTVAKSSV
jgi:hypothetical protein